ncbi:hypothetical protein PINS_up009218 [Pythium insidiosum]|nr:hypothetical protein PINS_up009218 [Pythium insidiosum]
MGSSASRPAPLAPAFQRLETWDIRAARRLLADYKEKDLDFGLDAQGLSELLAGDKEWAERVIDAFGCANGIINALALICGAILVSSGAALEKAELVFDALDFDMTEQITMDEMTIAFLCSARGFTVIAGAGAVPTDEELEGVTLQAYRELSKSAGQSITKNEFTKWVLRFIGAAPTAQGEVSIQDMLIQFGLVTPPPTRSLTDEVLAEMQTENQSTPPTEESSNAKEEDDASSAHPEAVASDPSPAEPDDIEPAAAVDEGDTTQPPPDDTVQDVVPLDPTPSPPQENGEHSGEYGDEFDQETPRDTESVVAAAVEPEAAATAEAPEQSESMSPRQDEDHASDRSYEDFTRPEFDASSGLPPPDPLANAVTPRDDPGTESADAVAADAVTEKVDTDEDAKAVEDSSSAEAIAAPVDGE